ncbi:class I tRNA ligase family protein, partial [candidate division WWE3 bacterium]|nr:class I tRNA ligase family protein [candidate division WWE3 bacterium]
MDKRPNYEQFEKEIYQLWEDSGYFNPDNLPGERKESYTILIPPPNASGKMHTGNILMIAIEDLLIRWKRMQGYATLYVPGTDHAGFETQITFERKLKEKGKSRLDYDRKTLYNMIWDFVQENKHMIENQIKSMGASVDWSRYTFMLDDKVIEIVTNTFKKMHQDGLVYRGDYMVNYCPQCGTTFADLEVVHEERTDPLYYIRYPLLERSDDDPEYLTVATVRPEPIFIDTHLAIHPNDPKRKHLEGRKVENPLTGAEMPIIADEFVDPEFGTGIVKLTPAHDPNDYAVAQKHGLPIISAIELNGTIRNIPEAGELKGLSVKEAREKSVEILKSKGLLDEEQTDLKYEHSVSVCYKAGHDIEPTVLP